MDYDRIFRENSWSTRIVEYAATGVELTHFGNAVWIDNVVKWDCIFESICHGLATIDPGRLNGRIGTEARSNLLTMMALFGNTRFPDQEVVATEIFDFLGDDVMHQIAKLASEHQLMVPKLTGPWVYGDREAVIDYQSRMPTRFDDLPHLRH
ncbi:MAG: hypothetical protein ACRDHN_11965 [Thermomicrobiales bacterium]